ncbi:hypothetical protein QE152_g40354 [Popillia japonica]|uniref:Transposable element P transposase-like RNase H C-terminal domain-containing protein n=1 Tax=Popillia japonica TaxID=7064 RepID=A0AAW1HS27_POPJA
MESIFKNIKAIDAGGVDKTSMIRNFKCWRVTINGLISLWEDLNKPMLFTRRIQQDSLENFFGSVRQQCGNAMLFTRRIQQDSLENFFGSVRQQCGNARNPTPVQFKRAFKKLSTRHGGPQDFVIA